MYRRERYLKKIIDSIGNGMIKMITGARRSGKSVFLFRIFRDYLLSQRVAADHIIGLALDGFANRAYRNPEALYHHVRDAAVDSERYYVLLDEVQYVPDFEDVLNGFLHHADAALA